MNRRILAILTIIAILLLCACAKPSSEPVESYTNETDQPSEQEVATDGVGALMGFIIEDDGQMPAYMMMHGFLRTAENLGHPAKLYRAKHGQDAEAAVAQALAEGCEALLVANPDGANNGAVQAAIQAGVYVGVPYASCALEGLRVNVVADDTDYIEELTRGIAERMTQRSLKSGRILVYGQGTADVYEKIQEAIRAYYPQYQVISMERTIDGQAAIDELAGYILYNRDIKGLYAVDNASASLAVKARNKADSLFRQGGAPTPSPMPTAQDSPVVTPNPALLTQISISVFGCGLSDENLELFMAFLKVL